ncbi:MAG: hypothetical protein ACTHMP_14855, partial [Thermomicrobiales bacterium]
MIRPFLQSGFTFASVDSVVLIADAVDRFHRLDYNATADTVADLASSLSGVSRADVAVGNCLNDAGQHLDAAVTRLSSAQLSGIDPAVRWRMPMAVATASRRSISLAQARTRR